MASKVGSFGSCVKLFWNSVKACGDHQHPVLFETDHKVIEGTITLKQITHLWLLFI